MWCYKLIINKFCLMLDHLKEDSCSLRCKQEVYECFDNKQASQYFVFDEGNE